MPPGYRQYHRKTLPEAASHLCIECLANIGQRCDTKVATACTVLTVCATTDKRQQHNAVCLGALLCTQYAAHLQSSRVLWQGFPRLHHPGCLPHQHVCQHSAAQCLKRQPALSCCASAACCRCFHLMNRPPPPGCVCALYVASFILTKTSSLCVCWYSH